LTSWDGSSTSTDNDGNLTRIGRFSNGEYSPDNQLMRIEYDNQGINFRYDPNGVRMSKVSGGEEIKYLYDQSGRLLLELSSMNVIRATYYHIGNRLAAMRRGGVTYFYHYDHVGSTLALSDANASLAAQYVYEPYGEVHTINSSVENPFTFNGAYGVMDDGNDLFYMKNRYYMASAGRFMQHDPQFFASSLNLYDFAHNNPQMYTDPEGDFIFSTIAVAATAYTAYKSYRFFKDNSDKNMRRIKNMGNENSIDDILESDNRRKQHENSSRKEGANTAYNVVKAATDATSGLGNNVIGAYEFANEVYGDVTAEEVEEDSWW
jgi:RHS repeat-associated protein